MICPYCHEKVPDGESACKNCREIFEPADRAASEKLKRVRRLDFPDVESTRITSGWGDGDATISIELRGRGLFKKRITELRNHNLRVEAINFQEKTVLVA